MLKDGKALKDLKVTITDGGGSTTYDDDFIFIHMGRENAMVLGSTNPMQLIRAVEVLMKSVHHTIEELNPLDSIMLLMAFEGMMKERGLK